MNDAALIFDLDGTLWDSTEVVSEAWSLCGKKYFGPAFSISKQNVKSQMGKMMEEIASSIASLTPDPKKGRLWAKEAFSFEVEYMKNHPGILYPKEIETLQKLKRRGYRLFIMSNCQKGYIEDYLAALNDGSLFADHLCYGDTSLPKHCSISLLMQKHGLSKAAYIGDTEGDEKETRLVGIPFIFASYGFGSAKSPDATLNSFEDILPVAKSLFLY